MPDGDRSYARIFPDAESKFHAVVPLLSLLGVLIASCALVVTGERTHSMAIDEANHLLRGVRALQTGDFSLSYAHPPLANLISAIPVALNLPGSVPPALQQPPANQRALRKIAEAPYIFHIANGWLWKYLDNPRHQLRKARLMNLFFLALMTAVVAAWSYTLWGWGGAILSATLTSLTPLTIAMSYFVGNDLAAGAVGITLLFACFHFWQKPLLRRAVLIGVLAGACMTTKHTLIALLLVPLLALLCSRFLATQGVRQGSQKGLERISSKENILKTILDLGLAGIGGLAAIWGVYAFTDGLAFVPELRLPLLAPMARLLPGSFLLSLDRTIDYVSVGGVSYLLGEVYHQGRWLYFPITYLVKSPLPELVLVLPGLILAGRYLRGRTSRQVVGVTATLGFGGLLMAGGLLASQLNIGFRHALPLLPIVAVLAGSWAAAKSRWVLRLSTFLLVWLMAETVLSHPHQLSYCNELAGGTGECHRYVGDSSIDWFGQDFGRVAAFQRDHQTGPLYVVHLNITYPSVFGIDAYPRASQEVFRRALEMGILGWVAAPKTALQTPGIFRERSAICELLRYEPARFEGRGMWVFQIAPERLKKSSPDTDIEACRERAKVGWNLLPLSSLAKK